MHRMSDLGRVRRPGELLDPSTWNPVLADNWLPRTAALWDALGRDPVFAAYLNASTAAEALMTDLSERQRRFYAHLIGRSTRSERRQRRELAARDERRSTSPRAQARSRTRRPHVFWHEGGDGPVLLLLNGWTASGLAWPTRWLQRLEYTFHVVRIDNRGCGYSRTAPAPFTMAQLADDAADVLDAVGARSATVLGASMGGMVAQELALRHPDMVRRLILVATRPPAPAHIASRSPTMLATLKRPDSDESLETFQRKQWMNQCAPGFAEREPARFDELIDQVTARVTPRAGVMNQLRAIAGWHGSWRLQAITAPTVVVHGDLDPLMPVGNGMRLAKLIPGARYVELPGVGHLPTLEAPEALEKIVLEGATVAP
jgi:pimeloyl-ACP methyl ester carboxylesterase